MDSPCLGLCTYNEDTKVCEFCKLKDEEASKWDDLTDQQQQEILDQLPHRQ